MPRLHRIAARVAVVAVVASLTIVPIGAAGAEPAGRCAAVRVPTDSQDVTCTLDRPASDRPLRFVAEFAGSHDDTRITLDAARDGAPMTCDAGSRTSLFAEDGVVHLDCRFRAKGGGATVTFALTVHHAQFVSSSLDAE